MSKPNNVGKQNKMCAWKEMRARSLAPNQWKSGAAAAVVAIQCMNCMWNTTMFAPCRNEMPSPIATHSVAIGGSIDREFRDFVAYFESGFAFHCRMFFWVIQMKQENCILFFSQFIYIPITIISFYHMTWDTITFKTPYPFNCMQSRHTFIHLAKFTSIGINTIYTFWIIISDGMVYAAHCDTSRHS